MTIRTFVNKKRTRMATISTLAAALVVSAVVLPASPASARPKDCSLAVRISPDQGAMYARADVNCKNVEKFEVEVHIERLDSILGIDSWKPVARGFKGFNKSGYSWVSTTEPCSDVQTTKKYRAHAVLYDKRLPGPGIEVKDELSGQIRGHC
ncbi:hypothetical protein [Actinoplanes sp. NPDC049118]|uniref:hypothetical protein n=1 Tax=Actinoplanes sp. NPDC049118 TaxID=3155769 RepID=UPI0033FA4D20